MSTVRFVVRPGETEFDGQSRLQGSLDLPLSPQGEQQVESIIHQLQQEAIDVIYASPTEPAATTAARIGEALGIPIKVIDGLVNLHLGLWQGMQLDEVRRKHPRVYKQWENDPESVCAPHGEECEEAHARVNAALRKPLKRDESFLVVAPEPIATLISGVIRGADAKLPGPINHCTSGARIERITPVSAAPTAETPSVPTFWSSLPSIQIPAVM